MHCSRQAQGLAPFSCTPQALCLPYRHPQTSPGFPKLPQASPGLPSPASPGFPRLPQASHSSTKPSQASQASQASQSQASQASQASRASPSFPGSQASLAFQASQASQAPGVLQECSRSARFTRIRAPALPGTSPGWPRPHRTALHHTAARSRAPDFFWAFWMFKKKSSLREVWDSSVKKGSSVSIARKSSKEQHTKTQTLTWTEKVAPEGGSCPQGLHRLSRNPAPKAK